MRLARTHSPREVGDLLRASDRDAEDFRMGGVEGLARGVPARPALRVDGQVAYCDRRAHAADDFPEDRVLAVKARVVRHVDEELRAPAVRVGRTSHPKIAVVVHKPLSDVAL